MVLRPGVPGIACCLLLMLSAPDLAADSDLQAEIERAERLNLTAPWEESQAVITELVAELDRATPQQKAQILFLEARNRALGGEYDEAIDLLKPLHDQDLNPELTLRIFRLSANIELQRDEFEQAYRYMLQGLELLPSVEAAAPKTNLLSMMADFYAAAGEAEKAIDYGERALEIARSSGHLRNICVANHDLSLAQEYAGRLTEALETRRRALQYCDQAGDPVHTGASRVHMGDLLVRLGREDEAAEHVRAGLQDLEESGFRDGIFLGQLILARLMVADGDLGGAEAILVPMLEEVERLGVWRIASEGHRLLAEISESRSQYREALEHQKQAEQSGDRVLGRERAMRVAYLQVELDTKQKEQQIDLLRERNQVLELQEETARQRQLLTFGTLGAVTVIGLLLFMLLIRTRSDRRHLLWLSQHDGLTGLRNHSSFFRRANEALAVCRHTDQPFTLVVADIDFFKQINDEHGHDLGDRVLREIGELLRSVFWPQGIVGRIGGEEFGMALPGMERDQARDLIDEFNARLTPLTEEGAVIDLTMSYGIAETQEEISVERLRRFGDQALYEAKRRGRNCVVDAAEITDEAAVQIPMNRRADDPA